MTSVKKRSRLRAERGHDRERLLVVPLADAARRASPWPGDSRSRAPLGVVGDERRVELAPASPPPASRMFWTRLKATESGTKSSCGRTASTASTRSAASVTSRQSVVRTASISSCRKPRRSRRKRSRSRRKAWSSGTTSSRGRGRDVVEPEGVGAGDRKVEVPPLVEEDPHDAERRASEGVRVLRARRDEAEAEEARVRVSSRSARATSAADLAARDVVVRARRAGTGRRRPARPPPARRRAARRGRRRRPAGRGTRGPCR